MNKPIKIYAEYVEGKALNQFYSAMKQDFAVKGALMPDTHTGYSLPIGAAIATDGVVLPSWVGYDIGCGMCALPLNVPKEEVQKHSKAIFDQIYRDIPVGFNINEKIERPECTKLDVQDLSKESREIAGKKNFMGALGSLGGGNHFIEIGADETDRVWAIIHSGSRGVGHGIAQHYMKLASPNGRASEGHFGFRTDSDLGQAYINDLNWVLQFALDNRQEMIYRVAWAITHQLDLGLREVVKLIDWRLLINRNHNHAVERDGLWIHRKGATHAEKDMMGVIPGNMRDGSFIVRGKGNPDSLYSSSHGAGRVLGRKVAKETLKLEDFEQSMQGITARVGEKTLDESPDAYKDIFEVMRQQSDLVDVVAHVRPIINIKG